MASRRRMSIHASIAGGSSPRLNERKPPKGGWGVRETGSPGFLFLSRALERSAWFDATGGARPSGALGVGRRGTMRAPLDHAAELRDGRRTRWRTGGFTTILSGPPIGESR
jgi:hypothetical protein